MSSVNRPRPATEWVGCRLRRIAYWVLNISVNNPVIEGVASSSKTGLSGVTARHDMVGINKVPGAIYSTSPSSTDSAPWRDRDSSLNELWISRTPSRGSCSFVEDSLTLTTVSILLASFGRRAQCPQVMGHRVEARVQHFVIHRENKDVVEVGR